MNKNWAFDEIRDADCQECSLHTTAQCPCLTGQGPRDAQIMLLGETPGWREDDIRSVFSGAAGQRLDRELERVGLQREDIYITNTVKCRPPDNRTPKKEEIEACRKHLSKELDVVRPRYLLLLGNPALWVILKQTGITKHRGEVHDVNGMTVMATFHLSALLHDPSKTPIFQADLEQFVKLTRGEKPPEPHIVLVDNSKKLKECLNSVEKSGAVSYDIESEVIVIAGKRASPEWVPGLRLWCIGIATSPDKAWVIPLEHPDSPFGTKYIDYGTIREILSKSDKKYIAQNGEFDNRWLRSRGVNAQHTFDVMLAAHLIDENSPHGLKPLTRRYLHIPFYKEKELLTGIPPLKELAEYCGRDACYTFALWKLLREPLLKDDRLRAVFTRLTMPATKVISHVEGTGIWIDRKRLFERTKIAEKERDGFITALNKYIPKNPKYKVNWNSNVRFVPYILYEVLRLPILGLTEKGKPSTAEPLIKRLKDKHPIVPLLLKYRGKDKQISTFLTPWAEYSQYDSRLRANYNLAGTRTGRLSSDEPNFQQVERGEFIRGIIGAPPGYSLISADLCQAEMRVAAMKSQDRELMRIFRDGEDIHRATAVRVTGKKPEEITKAERKRAKAINFGYIFGMGWQGFKDYALEKYEVVFSDAEAQEDRKKFFEVYPGLVTWHRRQRLLVHKFQQVRSPIGRIRHLPTINSSDDGVKAEAERQAINSPVQSMASDVCLLAAVILFDEIEKSGDDIRIVGLVHDCLLFECKDIIVKRWVPRIKQVMENLPLQKMFGFRPTVPVEVDIKVSKYWEGESDELPTKLKCLQEKQKKDIIIDKGKV